jgi:hypothetical protein
MENLAVAVEFSGEAAYNTFKLFARREGLPAICGKRRWNAAILEFLAARLAELRQATIA